MIRADDILEQSLYWMDQGNGVALATVIRTWGSSPRPVGSQLAVNDQGAFVGSVSGGCVEGAVVEGAQRIIANGGATILEFGISDEQVMEIGLTCGGSLEVLVTEAPDRDILARLRGCLVDRVPVCLISQVNGGQTSLITNDNCTLSKALPDGIRETARALLRSGECSVLPNDAGGEVFVHSFVPPPRLFIVGAGHIAQALVPMVKLAGFDVCVIDPRTAFSTTQRFPDTTISSLWPDKFFEQVPLDSSTAVITLVHDPKIDDLALVAALKSDAFYIGALGSRKTHEKRVSRFAENGFSNQDMLRIHAPIGLDLGGRKPPEIAVSIIAEVVQSWSAVGPAP